MASRRRRVWLWENGVEGRGTVVVMSEGVGILQAPPALLWPMANQIRLLVELAYSLLARLRDGHLTMSGLLGVPDGSPF
jgi:hypothetical protein